MTTWFNTIEERPNPAYYSSGANPGQADVSLAGLPLYRLTSPPLVTGDLWWALTLCPLGQASSFHRTCAGTFDACVTDGDCGPTSACRPRVAHHDPAP